MRRADRLFQLVQLVRGRRLSTARFLAERLEVSERTVYRDVADLVAQDVPIEGEAGVGYRMRIGFDLPPLMFTKEEAQSLVAAARIARSRLDEGLGGHVETAMSKILAVLTPASRAAAESVTVFAPPLAVDVQARACLRTLREATEQRRKVHLRYRDLQDVASERVVRPLGCVYWGEVWTLAAWCESRAGFRNFRVDRITSLEVLDERFRDEPGRSLADLMRALAAEGRGTAAR